MFLLDEIANVTVASNFLNTYSIKFDEKNNYTGGMVVVITSRGNKYQKRDKKIIIVPEIQNPR